MLVKNTLWMILSHLLSRGSIVFSGLLVAKFFNTDTFSAYSFFILTITTISIYSAMGLGVTVTKFYSQLGKGEDKPIFTLWLLNMALAIIGSGLFLFLFDYIVPETIHLNKFLMALLILFTTADMYNLNALIGLEKYKKIFLISLFSGFLNLIFLVLSIHINDISYIMYGLLFSIVFQFLFGIYFINSYFFKNISKSISISIIEIFKSMGPLIIVSIIAASGTWITGRFILNESSENFAKFSIGMQWYSLALFIPTIVSRVLLPYLIKNSNVSNVSLIFKNCYLVSFFCLLLAVISYFLHPYIQTFYGKQYDISQYLIPTYLLAAAISASSNILGNFIISKNKEKRWLLFTTISFLILLFLIYAFKSINDWIGIICIGANSLFLVLFSFFYIKKVS